MSATGWWRAACPRSTHAARIAAALERVGLAGYETRSALALSGGEAQRVALARALVVEPRVLLVDEPLASLDPLLKHRLTHDFASILREADVTVLYVTHDQDEAFVVADRVAIMNDGRIVARGPCRGDHEPARRRVDRGVPRRRGAGRRRGRER